MLCNYAWRRMLLFRSCHTSPTPMRVLIMRWNSRTQFSTADRPPFHTHHGIFKRCAADSVPFWAMRWQLLLGQAVEVKRLVVLLQTKVLLPLGHLKTGSQHQTISKGVMIWGGYTSSIVRCLTLPDRENASSVTLQGPIIWRIPVDLTSSGLAKNIKTKNSRKCCRTFIVGTLKKFTATNGYTLMGGKSKAL